MNYTLEQSKKIYQDAQSKGLDAKKVMYLMAKKGAVFQGADMNQIIDYGKKKYEPKQTYGQEVKSDLLSIPKTTIERANTSADNIEKLKQMRKSGKQGLVSTGLQQLGEGAKFVSGSLGDVIGGTIKAVAPEVLEKGFESALTGGAEVASELYNKYSTLRENNPKLGAVLDATIGKPVATAEDLIRSYGELKQTNPEQAKNLEAIFNIGMLGVDVATAGVGKKVGQEAIETGAKQVAKTAGDVASGVSQVVSPVTGVVEGVTSTIGSAVRRGKETVVEGVQEANRIAKLPPAEKLAARAGLDQGVVDFVKTSSKNNIPLYEKIISAAKTSSGNLRNGTAAKQIVGKEIIEKAVKPALQLRDSVGAKIGAVVEKLPTKKQDITPFVDEFKQALQSVGVTVGNKGKLVAGKGAVAGDLPAYQNMYNRIKDGVASQKDLHEIRSAVFKEFNLAKSRQQAFSDSADKVAEQFRSILGKGITNKNYLKYSKDYADVMNKLTEFVKYTGHKGDLEKLTAKDLRIAEIAQRTLGNASSRPQEVFDAIISLADKSGKKGISKEISDAIRFSDLIEDFYGIQQTRSMAGQVARGTKAGVEGATESLLEGATQGGLMGVGAKIVKGVLGKTTAEQQRALEQLIQSLKTTSKKVQK